MVRFRRQRAVQPGVTGADVAPPRRRARRGDDPGRDLGGGGSGDHGRPRGGDHGVRQQPDQLPQRHDGHQLQQPAERLLRLRRVTGLRAMRGRRADRGVTVVQLAIAMPVVLLLIMSVIQYALFEFANQVAEAAATEGLQAATVYDPSGNPCIVTIPTRKAAGASEADSVATSEDQLLLQPSASPIRSSAPTRVQRTVVPLMRTAVQPVPGPACSGSERVGHRRPRPSDRDRGGDGHGPAAGSRPPPARQLPAPADRADCHESRPVHEFRSVFSGNTRAGAGSDRAEPSPSSWCWWHPRWSSCSCSVWPGEGSPEPRPWWTTPP